MGWKDILRPIKDRLDDLLPPDGLDSEKRRSRRRQDALKGFTYFESFDQLEAWSTDEVDALQVANIPLLAREPCNDTGKAQVTLIHDYAGNYHDYESSQGLELDEERYCCEHLQFVDTFVYFSHNLVSVPPPTWTNTLHRNGVKSLGTFIVEPGKSHVEKILRTEVCENNGEQSVRSFPVAKKLAKIASAYGFDGWLINIEKTFPPHEWDLEKLRGFLVQLRNDVGGKSSVIWYDALTVLNEVKYQNSLTPENLPFLEASGHLLTNYRWNPDKIREATSLRQDRGLNQTSLLFGIDVWAQIKQPRDRPQRITWPEDHGGGTRTGVAVAEIAREKGCVGIFGPAMALEHFGKHGKAVDRSIWEGTPLPEDLKCDCSERPGDFHPENSTAPIIKFVKRYEAGSRDFFFTNFERAFTKLPQSDNIRAQVGSQSVLPDLISEDLPTRIHEVVGNANRHCRALLLDNPSRLLITAAALPPKAHFQLKLDATREQYPLSRPGPDRVVPNSSLYFPLFKLGLSCEEPLRVQLKFRTLVPYRVRLFPTPGCIALSFANDTMKILNHWKTRDDGVTLVDEIVHSRPSEESESKFDKAGPASTELDNKIVGIGIWLTGMKNDFVSPCDIIEIYDICIQPADSATNKYCIRNINLEDRGEGDLEHTRLRWQIREHISKYRDCPVERPKLADGRLDKRPWSDVTGPFSHFKVSIDGEETGRAYTLEYILPKLAREKLRRGKECKVRVIGVTFWGKEWQSDEVELPNLAQDWEIV